MSILPPAQHVDKLPRSFPHICDISCGIYYDPACPLWEGLAPVAPMSEAELLVLVAGWLDAHQRDGGH